MPFLHAKCEQSSDISNISYDNIYAIRVFVVVLANLARLNEQQTPEKYAYYICMHVHLCVFTQKTNTTTNHKRKQDTGLE